MVDQAKISPEQQRLIGILDYLKDWEKLLRHPICDVDDHREGFRAYEHELASLPGVASNLASGGDEIWLSIERLNRILPPDPPVAIVPWLVVKNDPSVRPQLVLPAVGEPIDPLDEDSEVFTVQQHDRLTGIFEGYADSDWKEWSISETPRRVTIQLYERLFYIQQLMQHEGSESPVELIWGIGLARWRTAIDEKNLRINYPLLTQVVEVDPPQEDMALRVRPTDRSPALEIDAFRNLNPQEIAMFEKSAREFLDSSNDLISPFEPGTFEDLLKRARTLLDTEGEYWPECSSFKPDKLPDLSQHLVVTGSWVIFARRRNTGFLVDDLSRLQDAIELNGISGDAPQHLVEEPSGEAPELPDIDFRGLSTPGGGVDARALQELYFPKPFNQEQVEIVQRLENAPGVVVQGPPGTGKTHTIANIVCHYLSLGRRVLVTSKGEAALAVLQDQIPDGIRKLTVSLLTNERAGKEQLERSVNEINKQFTELRPADLKQQIELLESRIDALHRQLARIDHHLKQWARRNIERVPEQLGNCRPEQLTHEVLESEPQFNWFPDDLSLEQSDSTISNEQATLLREARLSVGEDLEYASIEIPPISVLPSPEELASSHECLLRVEDLEEAQSQSQIPRLQAADAPTIEAAQKLLAQTRDHLRLIRKNKEPWLVGLRTGYCQLSESGGDKPIQITKLEELLAETKKLKSALDEFVASPVDLPHDWIEDEKLLLAIQNAANGKRPFGLLGIAAKALKERFAAIRIDGGRPQPQAEWEKVKRFTETLAGGNRLRVQWERFRKNIGGPEVPSDPEAAIERLAEIQKSAEEAALLGCNYDPTLRSRVNRLFPSLATDQIRPDEGFLTDLEASLDRQFHKHRLVHAKQSVDSLQTLFDIPTSYFSERRAWLKSNVGNRKISSAEIEEGWREVLDRLANLRDLRPQFESVLSITEAIGNAGAENWAQQLLNEPVGESESILPPEWRDAWRWSQKNAFLKSIEGREEIAGLNADRHEAEKDLRTAYEQVVESRSWLRLVDTLRRNQGIGRAITAYAQAIRSMTKSGKGKRDGQLRRMARDAMPTASTGVPCWIMPHWRVSEALPPRIGDFDLVIIDEASQSDAWAIPAIIRAKKILIVGDDKQVGPPPSFAKEEQINVIQNRLGEANVPSDIRNMLHPRQSIYDLGELIFAGQTIRLREHFRCAEPIIEFSNKLCYDREIRCVRVPSAEERMLPTLIDIHLADGSRHPTRKINTAEAEAVIDEIEFLLDSDFAKPLGRGKSQRFRTIGVVSLLGAEQAKYILDKLIERLGEEVILRHRIRCGDSRTFQGSEADVVFISAVDDSDSGAVMTENRIENIRRINVAVSRARDRLYFVHSFDRADLSDLDLRAKLLDHFANPLDGEAESSDRQLCESSFERAMFDALSERNYKVLPQVRAGRYRIDFVIEGEQGRRLAIECDGDQYHGPDQWMADLARQRTLERAGWTFWRCWGSSFARDPDGCLDELEGQLREQRIEPISDQESAANNGMVEKRILGEIPPSEEQTEKEGPTKEDDGEEMFELESVSVDVQEQPAVKRKAPSTKPDSKPIRQANLFGDDFEDLELFQQPRQPRPAKSKTEKVAPEHQGPIISVGDSVRFQYADEEEIEYVTISNLPSNPDLNIVNRTTPVAVALLGKREGENVSVQLPEDRFGNNIERIARILSVEARH